MHAKAVDLSADASLKRIFADDILMHRTAVERLVEFARAIVSHRTEHWGGDIRAVAGERQIFLDETLRHGMHGNKPYLVALTLDPEMHHALTALHVTDLQTAELLTANSVIEQGGQNGAITDTFERVSRRRIEQLARLGIAQRRRRAFIAVCHRPLDAIDRIAGHGIALAEIIEERGQGRELAPDAGG